MRVLNHKRQRGYVLIMAVLLFMGIGGVVMANFTQEARRDLDTRKHAHNQRVLAEAKQALLMFAYNYPQTNPGIGPGRLPCPDVDNNGTVDGPGTCFQVGRFPYADARIDVPWFVNASGDNESLLVDASGEALWYAVSDAFDNVAGGGVINSDTAGTITLIDATGKILYDGTTDGLAAVIIAPGARLRRDNDSDGVYETEQVRVTPADRVNPQNYLDTYTPFVGVTYNNAVFVPGSIANDSDGLLPGPVRDTASGAIVVNDQMVIITAEEVIAMAEKAVAETYRDALVDYQNTLALPGRYPWLAAYGNTTDLDIYNPQPNSTVGRVPFQDYFVDDNSPHSTIVSDLQIDFDVSLNFTSIVDSADLFNPAYLDAFSAVFNAFPAGTQTVNISNARVSFSRRTFNGAVDNTTDNIGTMIVESIGPASAITNVSWPSGPLNRTRLYFWDGCGGGCIEPANGWELCPVNAGDGTDCAKDNNPPYNFQAFTGDWDDHADIQIRMVEFEYVDPAFVLELDYSPLPALGAPTAPAPDFARFTATFNNAQVPTLPVADPAEPDTRNFLDLKVSMCDQDNYVGSGLNLASLFNADGGTLDCTDPADVPNPINPAMTFTFTLNANVEITTDWYPPLPRWVADNRWDDAVMLSYVPDFGPVGDGSCSEEDGNTGTGNADDCLVMSNLAGVNNDIQALLVLAGEHDLADGNDFNGDGDQADPGETADLNFADELHDIFETENYSGIGLYPGPSLYPTPNNDPTPASDTGRARVFDKREELLPSNAADTVFVIN